MIQSIFDTQGYDAAYTAWQRWQACLPAKPGVYYATKVARMDAKGLANGGAVYSPARAPLTQSGRCCPTLST